MVETQKKTTIDVERRKRIQAYKRGIIITLLSLIILPTILCIILFARVAGLKSDIKEIKSAISDINNQNKETKKYSETNKNNTENETSEKETVVEQSKPTVVKPYKVWNEEQQAIINQYKGTGKGKKIYLTFDDGPSVYTEEILEILDYYNVKVTFFVVGKEDATSIKGYKSIAQHGHTLGLHSYSHRYADIYSSLDNFVADLDKIQKLVYDCTGKKSYLYRFPGGTSTSKSILPIDTFLKYMNENGFVYYDWNATCGDGSSSTVPMEEIVTNIMTDAIKYDNCVALLHDAKSKRTTVDGLPLLIETLINAGFEICPITEDTTPVQHRVYE